MFLLVTAAHLPSCVRALETEGHIVVYIDTDAPLPRGGSLPTSLEPMSLLDTAVVEVAAADGRLACRDCRRELALDEAKVDVGLSFSIVADLASTRELRLHVVSYRAEQFAADPRASVEQWARVPPPPEVGPRQVTVELRVDDVGVLNGTREAPVSLREGPPQRPRATFAGARRVGCVTPRPGKGECVPGGAFWMGSPTDTSLSNILAPRLVVLAPFWLDAHEVTVREFRAGGGGDAVTAHSGALTTEPAGTLTGTRISDFCLYTPAPARFDDYPVNCIPFAAARAFCHARGGDLPTEAQFEYVGSGLEAWPFVWGRDRPTCDDSVVARGPRAELFFEGDLPFRRDCLPAQGGEELLERLGFPKPVTRPSLGRDALRLDALPIQDLAGNMAEWLRDGWQRRDGPCHRERTLRRDPSCDPDADGLRVVRGSSWTSPPGASPASWREPQPPSASISIGFRCAYSGR